MVVTIWTAPPELKEQKEIVLYGLVI